VTDDDVRVTEVITIVIDDLTHERSTECSWKLSLHDSGLMAANRISERSAAHLYIARGLYLCSL